jgi:hypothetical protein
MEAITETIVARSHAYSVGLRPYWHLIGSGGGILLHNVRNHEGICWSMSVVRTVPDLQDVFTMYGKFNPSPEKEKVWEEARLTINPALPTRMHSFFLFDDETIANRANDSWFAGQNRLKVEARVTVGARTHRADGRWIEDSDAGRWRFNAEQYWRGEMTSNPLAEIIVEGAIYFPGWKKPPFGFFGMSAPTGAS